MALIELTGLYCKVYSAAVYVPYIAQTVRQIIMQYIESVVACASQWISACTYIAHILTFAAGLLKTQTTFP